MHRFPAIAATLFLALLSSLRAADEPQPEASQEVLTRRAQAKKTADALQYKQGEINLRDGLAKISVPPEFRYLNPTDSETVLTKLWGNPPSGGKTLGMIFPANVGPLDPESWAVLISFEEDGYVKDDDASKINYDDLLKTMKKETAEENETREKKGYPSIELVGWAAKPHYDAATHKLYWAQELRFNGGQETTLNYNIRMLGRRGVLVLNAIAATSQLPAIEQAAPSILAMVNFEEGHRYTDFNPSTDKVATYGLAALVAGGILAKAGFFKVLLVGLLAAKKFVIVAVLALFGGIKKLWAKLSGGREPRDIG